MHSFRKILPFVVGSLIGFSNAYVGKWHSFTNLDWVSSLILHQGFVYAGTQGGIRRIDPATLEEKDYSNLDGLLDCSIVGLTETGDGTLWAVSKSGYVYSLSGTRWNASGQSYAAQQWVMKDRAVYASGQYLFLGSEKGLTVFDAIHKVAQANLTRFADKLDLSVLSLLARGDTLYIGTSEGVYKAAVDFSDPFGTKPVGSKFGNLSDPTIWKPVVFPASSTPRQYDFLAFVNGVLSTYGPGMLLQSPVHVEAFTGNPLVIGSKSFPANTDRTSALLLNGTLFLGGAGDLSYSSNPTSGNPSLALLPEPSRFPKDAIQNLAIRSEDFWGQSPVGLYRLNPATGDTSFFSTISPFTLGIPNNAIYDRHLRNLKVAENGEAFVGSWGGGFFQFQKKPAGWTPVLRTDPCIYNVLPNFPVVYAVSNVFKNNVLFAMFKAEGSLTNQLVHLNPVTGKISCLDSLTQGGYPHAVRMFSDSLVGVGSDRGMALYKIRQGFNAPLITSMGQWKTPGTANETWALASDALGRPWALIGDNLAYADSVEELSKINQQHLKPIDGFAGTGCYSMESDLEGSLWVGCGNGLFRVKPGVDGAVAIQHFGLVDGLLGLGITDISVDPTNGQIWIATDRGVSMLESSAHPPVADLHTVQVYPNPFRPQHRFVIFDNLPRDATVRIHTASGAVVRIFHPRDLTGNQAQWDGANENGKAVTAGVYLYSVTSGASVERGKVIVAR